MTARGQLGAVPDPVAAGAAQHDGEARRRIASALGETLFVEAGAGSGKTRALVERIGALVAAGARLSQVAAITFTDKAAAELRDRVRRHLDDQRRAARARGDHRGAERHRLALDDLDGAAIGTLHAFARRVLSEHPVEAGLPPRIEVLDEVASAVAFDDRWAGFVDELLADPAVERALLLATAAGVRLSALRAVALAFDANWDLADERAPRTPVEPPAWQDRLEALLDELDDACGGGQHCADEEDRLLAVLAVFQDWGRRVRSAGDELTRLGLLATDGGRPRAKANGKGAQRNWPADHDLKGLRRRIDDIAERCETLRNEVGTAAVERLAVEVRRFTLAAAEERRVEGRLEFHDLLVLARRLLRDPDHGTAVRASLHQHYRHLLIDEFQDTDPIQVELAVLIASPDADAGARPWHEVDTAAGQLFFVGDPKQSIYRFRRADISLFLRAADRFGAGGRRLALTTNHRAGAPVVDGINHLFGALIRPGERGGLPSQPAYEPSAAVRDGAPTGPPVAVLGRDPHTDGARAAQLRAREAAEVAATIRRAVEEGWAVDRSPRWQDPDWGPARLGDITILVPTRITLPALEDALTDAGIAYRAESASLVYASRLVRDLLLTVRAIEDPTDELATVAALRSPLFGCGDDDLFAFRHGYGGSFDHARPQPDAVPPDDVVARGLAWLHELHQARRWLRPSELLDRVVRERRVLELGHAEGRARDLWRRVRFVVDQARAWSEATDGSLRQYLDWIRQQTAEGARVAEAVLPETDDDAVRIMTVHAAKGLQFPVTIVAGLSTQPQRRRAEAEVAWPPGRPCAITIGRKVVSDAYEAWRPVDEQMSHDERIRLLYVACTRARDHLVVSLHRSTRRTAVDDEARLTSAELLASAAGTLLDRLPEAVPPGTPAPAAPTPDTGRPPGEGTGDDGAPPPFDEWQRERDQALTAGARPRTVAATALTEDGRPDAADDPGLHKRPRDLDLPPWRKGRYGTAVGRAVHGVLQAVDLAAPGDLGPTVAAQAAAEGVVGHEEHVQALVEVALAAPSVVAAASAQHWRELYVGTPLPGGRLLEGYVDLLYRGRDGLVVVDYKTGPPDPDTDLAPLVERYRLQGASYALAVGEATGEPVVDVRFVFLTPEGAAERSLPDLPAAVAHARHLADTDDPRLSAVG